MGSFSKFLVVAAAAASAAAAAYVAHALYRRLQWQARVRRFLEDVDSGFSLPKERLLDIAESLRKELTAGLLGNPGACLKMLPSYVDNLPDGSEVGVFYALDLGGTNFRAMRVLLKGKEGRVQKTECEGGVITPDLMTGTKEALFDMMASKLASFVAKESEDFQPRNGHHRELGFTFSFPCDQTSVNSGKLIQWTKGFNIPEAEGQDVVRVLEEAFVRAGVDIKVAALVNDAVGTLAGARYYDQDVALAVILGTGTNACYEETEDTSFRLVGPPPESGHMVINTEWGNFNSSLLPITEYDRQLDKKSPNWGNQQLEKLVSGMYLGEIMRLIMVDLQLKVNFFEGDLSRLFEPFSLSTPDASKIHADNSPNLEKAGEIIKESFNLSTSCFQRKVVKEIVAAVSTRGAKLSAACMFGVLKKIGRHTGERRTVVAVDGGLYENYTQFRETLLGTLELLLGPKAAPTVSLVLSKDGSGIGSALLAASHSAYDWRYTGKGYPQSFTTIE